MRRLIASTFLSLDGVMQGPGGPQEDETGGFALGGWTVPHFDDAVGAFMGETMGRPFDLVLGRRTYDVFAAHWPHASEDEGAGPLNAATKHVASRGTPHLSWQGSHLLRTPVPDSVQALKQQDGPELQVHGSCELLQSLLAAGLVDELRLLVFPVLLGSGKRLFGDGTVPATLRLVSSATSPSGVVMGVYQAAGELRTGSFATPETP